jgi:hypothetical protein
MAANAEIVPDNAAIINDGPLSGRCIGEYHTTLGASDFTRLKVCSRFRAYFVGETSVGKNMHILYMYGD